MNQHTQEPWEDSQIDELLHGCMNNNFTTRTIANRHRTLACVNGCADLNPTAYREVVEALKALLRYAIFVGTTEQFRTQAQHAVQHAEGKE